MTNHPRIIPHPDELYMGLAFWHTALSKGPNLQAGAVIVSPQGEVLGVGHAAPPARFNENHINWDKADNFTICSEHNAIKRSSGELRGATIYTTSSPCRNCVLEILDAGMSRVIWFDNKSDENANDVARNLATCGGLQILPFSGNLNWMRDRIVFMEKAGVFG